jgi:hypothetical protein
MLTKSKANRKWAVLIALLALTLFSCQKNTDVLLIKNSGYQNPICFDCGLLWQQYLDTIDHPTILGGKINNPYTVYNMTEAYLKVKGSYPKNPLPVTHIYVKFSPKDFKELDRLEKENIDLFDYPLDQQLISEGDYYIAPGKHLEDLPDYYAVVSPNFNFPSGIPHLVLEKMYIPDNEQAWEDEALRRTNNLDLETANANGDPSSGQMHQGPSEQESGHQDPILQNNSDSRHYPSGSILVQNELINDHSYRPVQDVKVVVRRLFKIESFYTNDKGEFNCKKYFKNKYTVLVKFKNDLARISRMRPWAIHEQFFPIKINFGMWSNLDFQHHFTIAHPDVAGTIFTSQWCAAITFNGIREHRMMCLEAKVGVPPKDLNIMLSSRKGAGHGNTYMLNKLLQSSAAVEASEILIPSVLVLWSPIGAGLSLLGMEAFKARSPDIKYGYGDDPEFLTTDRYDELVYHELSHASQYSQVGNNWWMKLGIAETKNPGGGFYGDCCTKYSFRIALAEGWAYFMGHYLSDKKWALKSTRFPEEGNFILKQNFMYFSSQNGISSHICFLESYNPRRAEDPDRWIPKGLFYDLCDSAGETFPDASGIIDNVNSFKVEQIYKAMTPEVESIIDFKYQLLKANHDYQHAAVMTLFSEYGY